MGTSQTALSEDALARTITKLQAFYDGLPPDEKQVIQGLVCQAAGDSEVEGFDMFNFGIRVGGKTVTVSPSDGGGSGTNPNSGKDGATVAAQPGGTPSGGNTTFGLTFRF